MRVLLAGEQVTAIGFEIKGFDRFGVASYKEDGQQLHDALVSGGHTVEWMRTSRVAAHFPETMAALADYDVIILSDVGSNSLLFHPQMLAQSVRRPNRLALLRDWVAGGGGLVMIGGWMSFSGIDGRARYHDTPLEQALPVTCTPWDDRAERPEGVVPDVVAPHPVLDGVPEPWPFFLGYNKVTPRAEAEVLLKIGSDPLLALWSYGDGRAAAFTSDCAPHWGPPGFLEWQGYPRFWCNLVERLARHCAQQPVRAPEGNE